jgi:hypothetical protein
VTLLVHKTLKETTEYYEFWKDRIVEAIFKINIGYLIILDIQMRSGKRGKKEADKF